MRAAAAVLVVLCALCACRTAQPAADCCVATTPVVGAVGQAPTPRLIVQITVDQLRADLPLRLRERFGPAGFARFFDHGVIYDNAFYAHATTETAVGHATLFTGALPRDHGIVGNEWYDLHKRAREYAVDDESVQLVGGEGAGKSPRKLLVPTLGDALVQVTGGGALVRAVSEKDRGAILPAGQRGLAYWLDDGAGSFVTSTFYLAALPEWVSQLTVAQYRSLPLSFTPKSDSTKDFTRALKHTPLADQFVVEFVRTLLAEEPLGRDEVPDLLSVSLSATDYIGHAFGPESQQAEANLLQLDQTLASLLELLETQLGREHVLFVLSADHGIAESPEWFLKRGEDAGRIDSLHLVKILNQALKTRLGIDADLVLDFVNPSLWLDESEIAKRGLALVAVEHALSELALEQPGFAAAYAREDVLAGKLGETPIERRVVASVHPTRSGHVYLVPKPHWLLATDPTDLVAMHGTPYDYDTHVPIYVLGARVKAAHVQRAVDPRDIAPTLARILNIEAPSGSTGQVLVEALAD